MPFNGSGTASPLNPPTFPAVSGQTIEAAKFNAIINDLYACLTQCVTKDGQTVITGEFQWADAVTNLAALGGVGLTGNQTIAGDKTFADQVAFDIAPTSEVAATDPKHLVRLGQLGDLVTTLSRAVVPIGAIQQVLQLTPPDGWLWLDGKTIGNAASGATSRADADCELLFAKLWTFDPAAVPIYTSTGAASARGATAAADFAAGKRLPLLTPDGGAYLRAWAPGQTRDASRVPGTVQGDAIRNITGYFAAVQTGSVAGGAFGLDPGGQNGSDSGGAWRNFINFDASRQVPTAGENRVYNLAIPTFVRYK